jgi:hypothetical protein
MSDHQNPQGPGLIIKPEAPLNHADLALMIGRLEGKVDALHERMDRMDQGRIEFRKDVNNTLESHSKRIGALERWRAYVLGIAAAAAAGVGSAWKAIAGG